MEYLIACFKITGDPNLLQPSRELIADGVASAGFESFEDTAEGINGYVQKSLLDKDALDAFIHDFPIHDVKIEYTMSELEDKDWNEQWEDSGFAPISIGNKILVYDSRHTDKAELSADDVQLKIGIEAKQAFGTGTHQTTQMVLSSLLDIQLAGKRVLDCGCGTGILGIAASKLGASSVVGYDVDEWSVKNTQHNSEINEINNLEALHGNVDVLSHVCGVFDVVLANINRNILLQDMTTFKSVMASQAVLIISGFYKEDIPLLLSKAAELGLTETNRRTDGDWACLQLLS